ncbi:hypothetical protein PPL_11295 [Heterostelium album PN500]|uniref:Uncharacterized protein n=1 Tax=Heterostelium pallidum (strain ATCC 26659 / Pp 5 / PN500) TaxID=670386 RepID=D3BU34_HETP5|nr:hypothetical protein PPL_11295 [Heterostelium album PN500]EFA75220.1 hypothetical protein PPL_11295 [Heterostelium album PN500]|eukprot:XP_020427354.1 hypothetical protein PPL_11295 [Heterostelium album PN500]
MYTHLHANIINTTSTKILTYLLSNRIPSTLKEYIVPYIRNHPNEGAIDSFYFEMINLNSSHVELSLTSSNNDIHFFEIPTSMNKDSQYSLYNKQNIHTLYLKGLYTCPQEDDEQDIEFKETIDSLPNLERLIIKTNNSHLLRIIYKQYPYLKMEVTIVGRHLYSAKEVQFKLPNGTTISMTDVYPQINLSELSIPT